MLNYALLFLSLVCGVTKNLSSKRLNRTVTGFGGYMDINLVVSGTAIVVFGAFSLIFSTLETDAIFLLFAALLGVATFCSQTFFLLAVRDGNVGVCSMLYSSAFLLPTFYSVMLGETLSPLRAIGVALILIAILIVSGNGGGLTWRTFFPALTAALASGSVGILQKAVSGRFGSGKENFCLLVAFLSMFLLSLLFRFLLCRKSKTQTRNKAALHAHFPLGLLTVSTVCANRLNLFLSAVLPGTLFFPFLNGGTIFFSALFSAVLFAEKPTKRMLFSLLLGLFAVVAYGLG